MREYYFDKHLSEHTLFDNKNIVEKLQTYLKECSVIIDIGCGNMNWNDKRIIGIDSDDYVVRKNLIKGENCICASSENIPLKQGMADGVICFDLFEHLLFPKNTMLEIYRILKPKGKFVVKVSTDIENREWFWNDYTHIRPFTHYSIELLIRDYHFHTIELLRCYEKYEGKEFLEGFLLFGEKECI